MGELWWQSLIDRWLTARPSDRVAIRFEGETLTYGALADRTAATAAELLAMGVEPGDRVAYCGLARPAVFELLFACARLGAIFLPLNSRLTASELGVLIEDSDPAVLLGCDDLVETLVVAAAGRPVRDLDERPLCDSVESGFEPVPDTVPRPTADAVGLMVYTSGTTGKSKGAMLSQNALLYTTLNNVDHQDFTTDSRVIACLPTFHVGGLNIQTLPVLYAGGEVLLMRRFDPGGVLDLITGHRPNQTLLVPAMLAAVASHPRFEATDLSCLVGINSGSSLVPETVTKPFFDRGVPVGQVYGATETGPTAVVLRYDEAAAKAGSCGRPATHTELRIVDDHGNNVDSGESGELWLKGPNLFDGYWRDDDATSAAFVDGWYRTGDVGHREDDGFVYISDRIKDMVISGGENVYPAELEGVLGDHPDIAEITVVGRPDDQWGEIPVAVVVPTEGASLELTELRSWCDGRLARFKWPRELVLVDALPKTALGKVQKHLVRAELSSD